MKLYLRVFAISAMFVALACTATDETPLGRYRSAVAAGQDAPLTAPATVLGIDLGMTDREYYDRCTELNRQELISVGRGGNESQFVMQNDLDRPARMLFRPMFSGADPRILDAVLAEFVYQDWSPWNRDANASHLLPEVADYLTRTLDTELIEIDHPRRGKTFAGVEGGRLVAIWMADSSSVTATIANLGSLPADPLGLVK
ncbi:hypothetical protein [Lewinella sp. IMCC34183]|uniref:hypothetical protein n=1 Tax=Lewinella sp. IMCC34183 TaxID=2248762 RepID=UPI000E239E4B|nr:hypothetical protein [Lewinella sp. IMCC34183]